MQDSEVGMVPRSKHATGNTGVEIAGGFAVKFEYAPWPAGDSNEQSRQLPFLVPSHVVSSTEDCEGCRRNNKLLYLH